MAGRRGVAGWSAWAGPVAADDDRMGDRIWERDAAEPGELDAVKAEAVAGVRAWLLRQLSALEGA